MQAWFQVQLNQKIFDGVYCPSDSDFLYNDQFCLGKNLVVWPPSTALAKLCQLTCLTAPEPLNKTFGIVLDGLRVTHWVVHTKIDIIDICAPLGMVRKILVFWSSPVRSGPEGPQFAMSVGTLSSY